MNTAIMYQYRDAGNYKLATRVVVAGVLGPDQVKQLLSKLDEGVYFIPGQVGLPELQPRWRDKGCNFPTEADHVYHEWQSIEAASDRPTAAISASAVFEAFMRVVAWDEKAAIARLGLPT